ncbi:MAG TPA: hypothetical protein VGK33_11010, partial [Chloroflexota bacterium]
ELGREGLELQDATASADGRLGAGRGVGAVEAAGVAWTEEPLASLWREPLDAQLDRAWSARESGQRAGAEFVFFRGVVRGVQGRTLELMASTGLAVSGLVASDHPALAYRSNLRLLGCAPGLPLLAVGRVVFGRPRSLVLLAIAAGEPDSLQLPQSLGDRVNLGLDRLQPANVPSAGKLPRVVGSERGGGEPSDPLDPLRRRLYQVVSGGRSALSDAARGGLARDEAALDRAHLSAASQVLRGLGASTMVGRSGDARRERLARSWLVAWTYLNAATTRIQRQSWTDT